MERIKNIKTNGYITSAIFETKDIAEVNILRRAILSEIVTYCIDVVIMHVNTSARQDEIIAFRLGQLIIDNMKYQPPADENFKYHIDVIGPLEFSTDDIPGLPFNCKTPILKLRNDEQIICDFIVKKGQGKIHPKWRPISIFKFNPVPSGYEISFKGIGMLSGEEIIKRGINKMIDAAYRIPQNKFSVQLIPYNMQ